jgi:hypothetical protein
MVGHAAPEVEHDAELKPEHVSGVTVGHDKP